MVAAILLLGLFQVVVFVARTAGYLFWGLSILVIGPFVLLVLLRWHRGTDSTLTTILGMAGAVLLGFENLVSPRLLVDGPPGVFPCVEYIGGGEYFFGYHVPFQPELQVSEPYGHHVIGLNLVLFGSACLFLGGWLWLGDLPETLVGRFTVPGGEGGEAREG